MKIAIFTETYLPYINGVVTHIKILKEGLEQLGHTVLVVTADPDTRRHYLKDDVLHCPAHRSQRLYGYGLASPVSRRRLKFIEDFDPDIIHVHQEFGIGLSGIMIAKIMKKPLVYTLHTMYDEYLYYVAPRALLPVVKKISHRYSRAIANSATEITGPSKKCQEYLQNVGVTKMVNVVPNAVELDRFNPDKISKEVKHELRRRYQIPEDATICCFVGRLGREKSVDVLLDYWAKTIRPEDKLHLIVIGDGPCIEELREQATALKISDMVTFAGKILHEDLPAYLAACDFYVTASTSDTNSISMLEGMATGLPVLQRLDRLNENQVRNGVNGYVFNSAEEMAEEMKKIRDKSPEELAQLKKSVIESVRKSGAADLANFLLTIYSEALKKQQTAVQE